MADDHLAADDHDQQHRPRSRLQAAVTIGGRVDGTFTLDPVTGAEMLGVLDHLAPPDPTDAPDGGCIFPSCRRPALRCDIHHINGFALGGATDVATMCCLCRRHHTLTHTTQRTIEINPHGTFKVTHPARGP